MQKIENIKKKIIDVMMRSSDNGEGHQFMSALQDVCIQIDDLLREMGNEKSITVSRGRSSLNIFLSEISYIYVENRCVIIVHKEGGEYLYEGTLINLQEIFGEEVIKAHRTCLIPIRAIKMLTKNSRGGYYIQLKNGDKKITVSRRSIPVVRRALFGDNEDRSE